MKMSQIDYFDILSNGPTRKIKEVFEKSAQKKNITRKKKYYTPQEKLRQQELINSQRVLKYINTTNRYIIVSNKLNDPIRQEELLNVKRELKVLNTEFLMV